MINGYYYHEIGYYLDINNRVRRYEEEEGVFVNISRIIDEFVTFLLEKGYLKEEEISEEFEEGEGERYVTITLTPPPPRS